VSAADRLAFTRARSIGRMQRREQNRAQHGGEIRTHYACRGCGVALTHGTRCSDCGGRPLEREQEIDELAELEREECERMAAERAFEERLR